ncbi:hypothetical protein ACFPOI_32125 [Nonomuraea angiospora]|uniref:ABC-type multidrug transport system fused ATPase/permease subunit n=1 Tax=Nonomuraea angiospora TaxID=46172 RepID=A0ABR9LS46_9ACTN|nr:hypothetical protein [Nonomuraea angiospora]MBE1583474.1 ABC-type multidrug transport system fused ATPase/permease subunit [Nonomuraea angiospora]
MRPTPLLAVLDGGRIVECGTHAELIDPAGRYTRLYDLQASAYQ